PTPATGGGCSGTRRRGRALHERAALEHHALVDLQARRVDVALHPARRVDLDRALGLDVPDHRALHDDLADVDLGLDVGALAADEHVVREHLTLELAVDAEGPLERQLALERRPPSEQGRDLSERTFATSRLHHGARALLNFLFLEIDVELDLASLGPRQRDGPAAVILVAQL